MKMLHIVQILICLLKIGILNIYIVMRDLSSYWTWNHLNKLLAKMIMIFFSEHTASVCHAGDARKLQGSILYNTSETVICQQHTMQILMAKNQIKDRAGEVKGVVLSFVDVSHLQVAVPQKAFHYNAKKRRYEFMVGPVTEFFTRREYDVFQLVVLGLPTKTIGSRLSISQRTAEEHVNHIKDKLQCGYKSHIVEVAMRYGII